MLGRGYRSGCHEGDRIRPGREQIILPHQSSHQKSCSLRVRHVAKPQARQQNLHDACLHIMSLPGCDVSCPCQAGTSTASSSTSRWGRVALERSLASSWRLPRVPQKLNVAVAALDRELRVSQAQATSSVESATQVIASPIGGTGICDGSVAALESVNELWSVAYDNNLLSITIT